VPLKSGHDETDAGYLNLMKRKLELVTKAEEKALKETLHFSRPLYYILICNYGSFVLNANV
jgi:hypothetical protein